MCVYTPLAPLSTKAQPRPVVISVQRDVRSDRPPLITPPWYLWRTKTGLSLLKSSYLHFNRSSRGHLQWRRRQKLSLRACSCWRPSTTVEAQPCSDTAFHQLSNFHSDQALQNFLFISEINVDKCSPSKSHAAYF